MTTNEQAGGELLPCPFCGEAANMQEMRYANTRELYGWSIDCSRCVLETEWTVPCWTAEKKEEAFAARKQEAITFWNTRAMLAESREEIPCNCKLVAHDTGDGWALNVEDRDGNIIADIAWPFGDKAKSGIELKAMGYEII